IFQQFRQLVRVFSAVVNVVKHHILNIETFLAAVRRYLEKSNANQGRVTIEYVMLDHVNDGTEHAHQLAELLKDTPCKINLIPW
ncbi:hypothetical protein ACUOFC_61805, partial [Escherichia sp. TWPC-MK]